MLLCVSVTQLWWWNVTRLILATSSLAKALVRRKKLVVEALYNKGYIFSLEGIYAVSILYNILQKKINASKPMIHNGQLLPRPIIMLETGCLRCDFTVDLTEEKKRDESRWVCDVMINERLTNTNWGLHAACRKRSVWRGCNHQERVVTWLKHVICVSCARPRRLRVRDLRARPD